MDEECPQLSSQYRRTKRTVCAVRKQLILQLGNEGKQINQKFKRTDSFFIVETNATIAIPKTTEPFTQVTQGIPLATPSPDEISNSPSKLHDLRMEVMTMKAYMSNNFR